MINLCHFVYVEISLKNELKVSIRICHINSSTHVTFHKLSAPPIVCRQNNIHGGEELNI